MDVRALTAASLLLASLTASLPAATVKSANFEVTAPTQAFAEQVSRAAEIYRHELAIEWLGEPLPGDWSQPCPIKCKVGQIGAGGATTFTFNGGEVFGWHMTIQGTEERILDSVLPHEISHMIFASYFRRPLPRWADEGAATLVEHESERLRQTKLLDQVIRTSKRIPLRQLLNIKEYPQDMQDVLTLYAEGYSLADYLVQQKGPEGKTIYLKFLDDAHRHGWEEAFNKHYATTVEKVEESWTGWVMAGSPPMSPPDGTLLASVDDSASASPDVRDTMPVGTADVPDGTIVRGQSTDELAPLPEVGRARRARDDGASLEAPRPRGWADERVAAADRSAILGERRTTAQPPQPTTLLEQFETTTTPSHSHEMPVTNANPRTATGALSREDSFGLSQPNAFDAPSGTGTDMTSSAPIAAANSLRGNAGAPNGLGPDSTGGSMSPDALGGGRTPSRRGFTSGRSGPSASSRGLFSP